MSQHPSFIAKSLELLTKPLARFGISASNQINAAWSVLDAFASPAFNLLLIPILTRTLGLENYGTYVLAMALGMLMSFSGLGINMSLSYQLASNHGKQTNQEIADKIATALWLTFFSCTVFALTIYLVANYFFQGFVTSKYPLLASNPFTIPIALCITIFMQCDFVVTAAFRGIQNYKNSSKLEFVLRFINFILTICVAAFTHDSFAVIACVLFNNLTNFCTRYFLFHKIHALPLQIFQFKKQYAKDFVDFGKWMTLQNLAIASYNSADKFFVGGALGSTAVGIYNVLLAATQLIHVILATASGFLFYKTSVNKRAITMRMLWLGLGFMALSASSIAVFEILLKPYLFHKLGINGDFDFVFYGLIVAHIILALNVPFANVGLSFNLVKPISLIAFVSSATAVCLTAGLIGHLGMSTVVLSKIAYSLGCLLFIIPVIQAVHHQSKS